MNKHVYTLIVVILAYVSIWNLWHINSILSIMILIIMTISVNSIEVSLRDRTIYENTISFCFSCLFCFSIVTGHNIVCTGESLICSAKTFALIIFLIPIVNHMFSAFCVHKTYCFEWKNNKINVKKVFLIAWILVFLSWIPILLAFYPGLFTYDSTWQLQQVLNNKYSLHHPILSTLFIGGLIKLGYNLTNDWNYGVLLHSLVQMLFMSAFFSYVYVFVLEQTKKKWICVLFLVSYMAYPIYGTLSITTTKDVIFSACVGVSLIIMLKLLEENELGYLKVILLIVSFFLLCAFRNNGMYALVFSLPFIVLINKNKKILMFATVAAVLLNVGFNSILKVEGVEGGSIREMLSIPIQQIGRTYVNEYDDLDVLEKSIVEELFWENRSILLYEPTNSDSLKNYFMPNKITKDFIDIYLKWGFKYPIDYIDAFLVMINGYFCFEDELPDSNTYRTYIEVRCVDSSDATDIHFESKLPFLYEYYNGFFEHARWKESPLFSLVSPVALYIWGFIASLFYLLYNRKFKFLWPYSILLGLLITNLFGPVAILRYAYPFVVCVPIYIYCMFYYDVFA